MSHVKPGGLAAKLDVLVKLEAMRKTAAAERERQEADRRVRHERTEARRIFNRIEIEAAEVLAEGRVRLTLIEDETVGSDVDGLTGVAGFLRDLLAEEGLRDRLKVDIDCSGDHVVRNCLMLDLVPPERPCS